MKNRLKVFIPITVISCMLAACGTTEEPGEVIQTQKETTETAAEIQETEAEQTESLNASENKQSVVYEVSETEAAVYYEGEVFEKSVFKTGGDRIYICGIKEDGRYFLGVMDKEEKVLQEIPTEMPENMRIINMAAGSDGDCHILWSSVEEIELNGMKASQMTFEKSLITKIDKEGRTEHETDITEILSKNMLRPFCFHVDMEGNYYIEDNSEANEIIKVCRDGSVVYIPCQGEIETIGNGKSGAVYCVYVNDNGEEVLGRAEENEVVPCDVVLPSADARYSSIDAGTDTELLIYNKMSGIFSYDLDANAAEQRVEGSKLPICGQDVSGYGFLRDGRLCLLEQNEEATVFYYIPAGK